MKTLDTRVHRLLLPLFAALALLACGATSVHAEELPKESEPGFFAISGSPLEKTETFTGEQEGESRLLVSGRNLEINCKKVDFTTASLHEEGHAEATLLFLSCLAYSITPLEELPCFILPNNDITVKALLLATVHGAASIKPYVVAEPLSGSTSLATIEFEEETECPLPLKTEITGAVSGEVLQTPAATQLIKFNEEIQKLLGTKLRYGVNQAIVDGSAKSSLTGANKGASWGVPSATLPEASSLTPFKVLGSNASIGTTFAGEQEGTGTFLLVAGQKWEVKCQAATLTGEVVSITDADIKISYSKCTPYMHNTETKLPCSVTEPVSVQALLRGKSHGSIGAKKHYLLAEGKGGGALTLVKFTGPECTLPETVELKGTFSGEFKEAEAVEQLLSFTEATQKLIGDQFHYGIYEAFVKTNFLIHLTGAKVGCGFGVA